MSASTVCTRIMGVLSPANVGPASWMYVHVTLFSVPCNAHLCVVLLHMLTTDGAELVDKVLEYVPIRVNSGSTGNVYDELPR